MAKITSYSCNLDNSNLFYYDFLFNYLHLVLDGHNPLAAYLRASQRSHASQSLIRGVGIAMLRWAWNSFARLLNLDFEKSFQCPLCGPAPDTVVCDGTMLGFRKDLLTACSSPDLPEDIADKPLLRGSKHCDRVLIHTRKARELCWGSQEYLVIERSFRILNLYHRGISLACNML